MNVEYRNVASATSEAVVPPPLFASKPIKGRALAYFKTQLQAAAIAAQIKTGERSLVDVTIEQVALLTHANRVKVGRIMRLTGKERQALADGTTTKLPAVPKKHTRQLELPLATHQSLLSLWNMALPAERVAFARVIRVERCWNRGITR